MTDSVNPDPEPDPSRVPYSPPPPYPSPPYPQQQPPQVIQIREQPTSGLAIASLVLGILGLVSGCCSFGLPSILAVVLGHIALNELKLGTKRGDGLAKAGLIMGYIVAIPAILLSVWFVVLGGIGAISDGVNPGVTPTP